MITFIQYLLPNGRMKETSINRSKEIEELAKEITNLGYLFEIEVLSTGHVNMEIVDPSDLDNNKPPIAGELCLNGPAVPESVDKMVKQAAKKLKIINKKH